MSSFAKETVNAVNQKCSSCQSVLHLYPNNQLFLKIPRVSEASRYTQIMFDWCILNDWKMCFSLFWHQTDPCTTAPGMWFLILEFVRAPSGVFSSWCAAVLKGIMHVNLATARRDLMSCTGLDLIMEVKFVIKWKQCQGKNIVTPEKRKTFSNATFPPEILHLKQLEWFL